MNEMFFSTNGIDFIAEWFKTFDFTTIMKPMSFFLTKIPNYTTNKRKQSVEISFVNIMLTFSIQIEQKMSAYFAFTYTNKGTFITKIWSTHSPIVLYTYNKANAFVTVLTNNGDKVSAKMWWSFF